ncbi:phage portal protein [Paraburkholderia sp. MM5477-R1]|uniref:phage portal protein n=1 Tax=Paraburkholderia sp. MM5477-R1 TaxID=2991062 RepID=UPI003D236DB8
MRILGLQITRAAPREVMPQNVSPVNSGGNGGWWPLIIREPFSGAWQQNRELAPETVLAYHAVYACITLISADIGKLGIRLMQSDGDDIWYVTQNAAYSPVLRKPNSYQNRIQFIENWIMSKLTRGNAYVLKERDARGVVVGLYVLDPYRVLPLVTDDGSVYYRLNSDKLANLPDEIVVPASEIIHDRMNCLFHPLVGTSPLFACALAARQGLAIQNNSASFFENGAQPGGVLVAPGAIGDDTAKRLKDKWEENFGGVNRGRLAVLGDGLKYEALTMNAVDAQLIEQLKMTAEIVCSVFHVPGYMVGIGTAPTYNNIEALSQNYYSQCLQSLIESLELCMDEGLAVQPQYRTECDLDGLLRMDTATMVKTLTDGVGGGIVAPNEARRKLNMKPVKGGQTPYLQQQNYSLAALDERDRNAPFAKPAPTPATTPTPALPAADEPAKPADEQDPQKVYALLMARLNGSAPDHG